MSEGPKGGGEQSRKLPGATRRPAQLSGTPAHSCQLGLRVAWFYTTQDRLATARYKTHTQLSCFFSGHRHMLVNTGLSMSTRLYMKSLKQKAEAKSRPPWWPGSAWSPPHAAGLRGKAVFLAGAPSRQTEGQPWAALGI